MNKLIVPPLDEGPEQRAHLEEHWSPLGIYVVSLVACALLGLPLLVLLAGHPPTAMIPLGAALSWQPLLMITTVGADLVTGVAYVFIAGGLVYLARTSKDAIPFLWTFVAFGLFIVACGLTHLIAAVTMWTPAWWLAASVKYGMATVSVAMAVTLPSLLPLVRQMTDNARKGAEYRRDLVASEAALRASQERFTAFMDHGPIMSWVKDEDFRYLYMNKNVQRLWNVTPDVFLGKDDFALALPFSAKAAHAIDRDVLARWAEVERIQAVVDPDGTVQYWSVHTFPFADATGTRFIGSLAVDVTVQQRLTEASDRVHAALSAEFDRAAEIQASLLPQAVPNVPGYEFAGTCVPAQQVGGDYFDWQEDEGKVRITLADVMSKGMSAALLCATLRAAMRAAMPLDVSQAVTTVNLALIDDLVRVGSFITLFCVDLDSATGNLTYVDAGHGMAFIHRRDGSVWPIGQRNVPLGIGADTVYLRGAMTLEPGDTLVIHSDGLPDARSDLRLDPAGIAAHLDGLVRTQTKLDHLVALGTAGSELPDDLTLVMLHRLETNQSLVSDAHPAHNILSHTSAG